MMRFEYAGQCTKIFGIHELVEVEFEDFLICWQESDRNAL